MFTSPALTGKPCAAEAWEDGWSYGEVLLLWCNVWQAGAPHAQEVLPGKPEQGLYQTVHVYVLAACTTLGQSKGGVCMCSWVCGCVWVFDVCMCVCVCGSHVCVCMFVHKVCLTGTLED